MISVRKIELLAPAKNAETGIEAINHGADAVYIGAPKFSARSAAGNSIEDIRRLAEYAHLFHAKVYVAFNTILYDNELAEAEKLIWEIYRAGADALIIQDMGILQFNLPPIALHASTQTDNRTLEKVQFLEKAGFSQVVLARELSLEEICNIASQSQVRLEAFVHGALCTSFSGQCYISQAISKRSSNRGECAQYCRLPYTLSDAEGKFLQSNKHLLSLKDLNQAENLENLLDAGVTSLKIEGRLKETSYVKNITACYRQKLNAIFERRPEYCAASSGETTHFFVPNPEKSFNRGFTDYFLFGRKKDITAFDTPKSTGEPVGEIRNIQGNYFTIASKKTIHNGDGLCFFSNRQLAGFRVNKVENDRIYPVEMPRLDKGTALYRNYDHEFEKTLSKISAERKINLDWILEENNFGFSLTALDADGYSASITFAVTKELAAKDPSGNIREQLSKLGATPFKINNLTNHCRQSWFIPSSALGEMRRRAVEALLRVRKIAGQQPIQAVQPTFHPYPETELSYLGNVANEKAKLFYQNHGVSHITSAFEIESPENVPLMFAKHCLKYQLGACTKQKDRKILSEPLTLTSGQNRLNLHFDCARCEMLVEEINLQSHKKTNY
ncbi:collagenase [Bacteroidia bacterium]|nr:collagenase [Bacteroidia bacterium]